MLHSQLMLHNEHVASTFNSRSLVRLKRPKNAQIVSDFTAPVADKRGDLIVNVCMCVTKRQ
jgi:hypothetical protein